VFAIHKKPAEITNVFSAALIKKVIKCSLLVTPTTPQYLTFIRIEDYWLKGATKKSAGA